MSAINLPSVREAQERLGGTVVFAVSSKLGYMGGRYAHSHHCLFHLLILDQPLFGQVLDQIIVR